MGETPGPERMREEQREGQDLSASGGLPPQEANRRKAQPSIGGQAWEPWPPLAALEQNKELYDPHHRFVELN